MSRLIAYGFGLSLLAATIEPAFRDAEQDSFPFSTYPMFARPGRTMFLNFAEGVDAKGARVRLTPDVVANSEVMQASKTLRGAVASGSAAVERLCQRIASRVREREEYAGVVRVQIVGARFTPVRYFVEGPEPEERTVHGGCAVTGRGDAPPL